MTFLFAKSTWLKTTLPIYSIQEKFLATYLGCKVYNTRVEGDDE